MTIYEVAWKASGVSTVEADTEKEAEGIVINGCFNFDDIDFERTDVNDATVWIYD